jgi:hypothetical protein
LHAAVGVFTNSLKERFYHSLLVITPNKGGKIRFPFPKQRIVRASAIDYLGKNFFEAKSAIQ